MSTSKTLRGDRNQCPTCAEYFNSGFAFSKHRIGKHGVDRRCMSVAEMDDAGMSRNQAGFWISSANSNADFRSSSDSPLNDRQPGDITLARSNENAATHGSVSS